MRFGKRMVVGLAGGVWLFGMAGAPAKGAVVVRWTFEAPNVPPDTTGTTTTNLGPAVGSGTASGVHASAATAYTTPSGNGSAESLSSNNWAVGDYYQFTFETVGYTDLSLTFDAMSSNTGPRDFKVAYSVDGTNFTDVPGGTYSVANSSFSSLTEQTTTPPRFTFDLSAIDALEEQASVTLRLIDAGTTAVNGGTVATGGTSRVDNVTITSPVPEPASVGLVVAAGFGLGFRRRRRA